MDTEKNPIFYQANSFNGTCKKCESNTTVRYLKAYPKIRFNFQRYEIIGPFDRYCAYTEKLGNIPIFYTQPKGLFEGIYRYLTRLEIPYGKNRSRKMISDTIRKFLSDSMLFIFIILLLYTLLPFMILWAMALLIFHLPFFVSLIIRFVRMVSKNPGFTKSSNFEKFWDGQINKQDSQFNYYIRKIIIFTVIFLIFGWVLSLENEILSYIGESNNPVLSSIYKIQVGLIFIHFVSTMAYFFKDKSWDKYTAIPKDVHQIAMERKREEQKEKDEETSISTLTEERLRNPFASITKLLIPSPQDNIDFICQICKTQVDKRELEVYCENCCRYFHKEHITTHLNELEKKGKNPICPVCYFDAKIVFSEIEWKSQS